MTDLATTFDRQTAADDAPSQQGSAMVPTTLITEAEVRLGTAAAVVVPPARTRGFGDVVREAFAKVRAVIADANKPSKRHYPKRRDFLEDARMSRMMDRL